MGNIVIVSHCVLNSHSKIKKYNMSREIDISTKEFVEFLLKEGIGIIQLHCPESHCYGLNRWGHTKNQFDHAHYREECRSLFKPVLNQIINYENAGYNVLAMVGMYGSPTCGVNSTNIGDWGGQLSQNPNLKKMISQVRKSKESGIFIEEISDLLSKNNLDIPMLEYNRRDINRLKGEILDLKEMRRESDKMLEIV